MEIEAKESRKLRLDKSLELCEWLMSHRLSLKEAAVVLACIEDGKSFAESVLIVFLQREENMEKRTNENLPNPIFNDPVAF